MLTINYSDLQAKALSLIKTYGLKVTISRAGTKIISTYGVFAKQDQADDTKSKSSILAQTEFSQRSIYLAAVGKVVPAVGDILASDKETFTIKSIETLRPGGTTVYYKAVIT
jgi:hypothetical protein